MRLFGIFLLVIALTACGASSPKPRKTFSAPKDACTQLKDLHQKRFNPKKIQSGSLRAYLAGTAKSGSSAGGAQAKANYLAQIRQLESASLKSIGEQCSTQADHCSELRALHKKTFDPDKINSEAYSLYLAGVAKSGSSAGGAQAKANYLAQMQKEETNSLLNISKKCS